MYKGFKVKIYPTEDQKEKLFQFFGAARFTYNWVIEVEEDNYKKGLKFIQKRDLIKLWTKEKTKYPWVKEISGRAFRGGIYDAVFAYERFFNKLSENRPKFKKKICGKQSCYTNENRLLIEPNRIRFEKLGWVKCHNSIPCGWITINGHRQPDRTLYNPRLSFDGVDFWFGVALDIDIENIIAVEQTEPIGIDLGLKRLAVDSEGINCVKPDISKYNKKLKRLHKRLRRYTDSRMQEAQHKGCKVSEIPKSKNLIKLEYKINKVYKRINNILKTNIHQYTTKLVKRNPKAICIEDLYLLGLHKNKHIHKKLSEANFSEFKWQLTYKCKWHNIPLIIADRFYPSSKKCSCCGNVKKHFYLNQRTYICEKCGYIADRDYNAALNLKNLAYIL